MDAIPFVVETASHNLPDALQQNPIFRNEAIRIRKLRQADHSENHLFIGTYSADRFEKYSHSEAGATFYAKLAEVYLDIYGNAPWNEFLSCSKENCFGKKSISDVHGTSIQSHTTLRHLEAAKPTCPSDHACPICGSPMQFYYPPGKILANIKKELNHETVAAFLLNQQGKIEGFSWAWFGTIETIARKLMAQLGCSNDSPAIASTKRFFESNQRERMLFLSEWAVSYAYRNTALPLLLLSTITFLGNERAVVLGDNDPVFIGVSFNGSSATNAYRRFGASTIFHDPKADIVILGTPIQRALEHYARVERALTKRLLRNIRRRSVVPDREYYKIAV